MSNKKELNDEELEKVNGGEVYFGCGTPTVADFKYKIGDIGTFIMYTSLDPNSSQCQHRNCLVKGHAIKRAGAVIQLTGFGSYSMYYKLEFVDRDYAVYDGWYDSFYDPSGLKRAPADITILDEVD